jgi:hypothetical protein
MIRRRRQKTPGRGTEGVVENEKMPLFLNIYNPPVTIISQII